MLGSMRGWLRYPKPNPENPNLDMLLTLVLFAQFIGLSTNLYMRSSSLIMEFFLYFCLTAIAIPVIKSVFRTLVSAIGRKENLEKSRNIRKFGDQAWQLTIHAGSTLLEVYLLNKYAWFTNWRGKDGVWEAVDQSKESDPLLNSLYLFAMAVWSYTAISHRFHEARHKDYFLMYAHHVLTIALVGLSWASNTMRIGSLVMFLHDSSDIIGDLLKMANYAGLDEKSGLYLTESLFVTNLLTWFYARLYLFPMVVLYECIFTDGVDLLMDQPNPPTYFAMNLCRAFLSVLFCMNAWWFFLFVRMGYRLLFSSQNAHDVGRDEYEGESSESEDEDRGTKVKKN